MRLIDADHLRRWILSRVFKTQLSVADVIDQIDREDTIEPEPQWIPCSDQLPDEEVLCCDTRGEMIIGYPYQDEESSTGYGAVLDDVVMIDCIAWMPLPEPYHNS